MEKSNPLHFIFFKEYCILWVARGCWDAVLNVLYDLSRENIFRQFIVYMVLYSDYCQFYGCG